MSRRDNPFEKLRQLLEELQQMNDMDDKRPDDEQSPFGDLPFEGDSPFDGDSPFGPNFDMDDFPFGEDGFDQDWGDFGPGGNGGEIAIDVLDLGDAFEIAADLPGFEKDDIDLTLSGNTLHISASRDFESEDSDGSFIQRERFTEAVSRVVEIPDDVDDESVDADFSNGVLTVTLPKVGGSGHEINIE